MMQPKRTKWRKLQKGRNRGKSYRANTVAFGSVGLKAITAGRITARQVEAARIAMTRKINRQGKVWIRVFTDKPLTKKPLETRMGKGKGPIEEWVMNIKPGRILYEIAGVSEELAREAMAVAGHKLGFKTKFVTKEMENELY